MELLLATWAHRDGVPGIGLPDCSSMQARVDAAYLGIAWQLEVGVAPAGAAWAAVRAADPTIDLWQDDGSHPSSAETYLAACVAYAAVFGASHLGLGGGDDLPDGTRRTLQEAAAAIVLGDPSARGLPPAP